MILKYCFKDEIHKSFSAPPTFIQLLKEVTSIFADRLPPTFSLQYRDNDGDFVTISSDVEYLSMLKFDLPRVREMVRIFVIPSHQSQMMEADVKPVDLSLSSKKSSDGSFEVIEENSQNTSGNISEFSLNSEESPSKKSKTCSEASSTPKIIKEFNFQEESSNDSIDFDQSVHSHNDTIDKIEAKLQCKKTIPVAVQSNAGDLMDDDDCTYKPVQSNAGDLMDDSQDNSYRASNPTVQNNAGDLMDDNDDESSSDSYESESQEDTMKVEQLQTSIDKILNFIQPTDCSKSANFGRASPTQYYSLDNSVLSKEINQAAEELAAIRIRRIINRLKNLQPPSDSSPSFTKSASEEEFEQEEDSLDLHDIKPLTYTELGLQRRARIMSVVSAALVIQTAFRRYRINKLMKVFREFEASYPLVTEEERPVTRKDQSTQMIPLEYQYEFSETMSEASSFSIKTPTNETHPKEEWNLQKIQPKDYRVSFVDDSIEHHQEAEESPMKKCYHCEDFEYCEHYHSGYNNSKPFNDSHMMTNYRFKAPCKFNYIPSPILKGRYDSYFMQKKAETNFNYRLLPGMSSTPVFMSSIDDKKIAYKTVYLINTGSRPWRKCYVKAMGPISGKTAEVYNVDVGQIALATLELNGHYGAESYKSQWKIIHENENGMMEAVGEPFEVDITFEVKENMIDEEIMREMREQGQSDQEENNNNQEMSLSVDERKMDDIVVRVVRAGSFCEEEQDEERNMSLSVEEKRIKPFYPQQEDDEEEEELEYEDDYEEEEEDVQEEIYEEEEESEEEEEQTELDNNMQFGAYQEYLEEIAKVKEIGRHFPCDPWDEIFDFVLERAYMSIEQIYEEYVSYRNKV